MNTIQTRISQETGEQEDRLSTRQARTERGQSKQQNPQGHLHTQTRSLTPMLLLRGAIADPLFILTVLIQH